MRWRLTFRISCQRMPRDRALPNGLPPLRHNPSRTMTCLGRTLSEARWRELIRPHRKKSCRLGGLMIRLHTGPARYTKRCRKPLVYGEVESMSWLGPWSQCRSTSRVRSMGRLLVALGVRRRRSSRGRASSTQRVDWKASWRASREYRSTAQQASMTFSSKIISSPPKRARL